MESEKVKCYRTKINSDSGKITFSLKTKPGKKVKKKGDEKKKKTFFNFKKLSNKEGVLRNKFKYSYKRYE